MVSGRIDWIWLFAGFLCRIPRIRRSPLEDVLISLHAPRRYFGLFQKFFLIIWLWANNHLCCHNTQRGIFVLPNNSMPLGSGMGTIYLPTRTALSMVSVWMVADRRRGARYTFLTYLTEVGGSQHDILFRRLPCGRTMQKYCSKPGCDWVRMGRDDSKLTNRTIWWQIEL